jgi:hypothetical protein
MTTCGVAGGGGIQVDGGLTFCYTGSSMIEDKFFDLFNESLKVISSYCPVCNSRYNPIEAKILEEKDDVHLIHIRCRHCQVAILALVMVNSMGVSSVGLVTDLASDEVVKFKNVAPITVDDVIEIHQVLNDKKVLIEQLI